MVTIYGIKNCSSVSKAIKYMKRHELPYAFVDFRETQVSKSTIETWASKVEIEKLFNKRGTTYRTLKLKNINLDRELMIEWLAKENMLLKRPVIEHGDKVLVAYDEALYDQTFL